MKLLGLASTLLLGCLAPSVAFAQYGQQQGGQGGYGSSQGGAYGGGQGPTNLESGGLAPPSSPSEDAASVQTEEKLEEADKRDSGRGLEFFYLNAEAGFSHLGLQTFKANHLLDSKVVDTTQTGPAFGAGLGLRLVFFTVGARFRLASFSQYDVWTLNGELGLRIPLGSVEPYFLLGAGFASLGSFGAGNLGGVTAGSVNVTGYDVRGGGGVDVYVTPVFSIGAALTGELLGLSRPGVDPTKIQGTVSGGTQAQARAKDIYAADGSSLGSAVTGTVVLGLHF